MAPMKASWPSVEMRVATPLPRSATTATTLAAVYRQARRRAARHHEGTAGGRVERDAAGGVDVGGGDRHDRLELRPQPGLLAHRTARELLDFEEDDAGKNRSLHPSRMQGLQDFEKQSEIYCCNACRIEGSANKLSTSSLYATECMSKTLYLSLALRASSPASVFEPSTVPSRAVTNSVRAYTCLKLKAPSHFDSLTRMMM